jgi:hypothetical protein
VQEMFRVDIYCFSLKLNFTQKQNTVLLYLLECKTVLHIRCTLQLTGNANTEHICLHAGLQGDPPPPPHFPNGEVRKKILILYSGKYGL